MSSNTSYRDYHYLAKQLYNLNNPIVVAHVFNDFNSLNSSLSIATILLIDKFNFFKLCNIELNVCFNIALN